MDLDEYDERTERHRQTRNTLRGFGLVIFPIGIITTIAGFILFVSVIFTGGESISLVPIGFIMFAAGGFMSTIGFGMLGWGFQGKIASYSAMEAKDAATIAGDAGGEGLARGIRRSGGLKLDTGGGRSRSTEVVKIRCRKCGYIDSEDAKYCSKCGARI